MKIGLGDRYKWGNTEYIVASAGVNKVVLISLESGGRADNPVNVKDHHNISAYEWNLITGHGPDDFEFVRKGYWRGGKR